MTESVTSWAGDPLTGATHLGVEVVAEGAATRLAPGVHASYGARLGLGADLGSRWGAGVTAQFDAVTGWNQRAAAAWVSYGPEGGRTVGLPAIHGDSVAAMAGCL